MKGDERQLRSIQRRITPIILQNIGIALIIDVQFCFIISLCGLTRIWIGSGFLSDS